MTTEQIIQAAADMLNRNGGRGNMADMLRHAQMAQDEINRMRSHPDPEALSFRRRPDGVWELPE